MLILFTVTVLFILLIELPDIALVSILPTILTAGLAMLVVILAKMSNLTHQKAKTIWAPLEQLQDSKLDKLS